MLQGQPKGSIPDCPVPVAEEVLCVVMTSRETTTNSRFYHLDFAPLPMLLQS